ncbi:MAG: hypothetical protein V3S98_07910 [Dehalococcoidia bacterium]
MKKTIAIVIASLLALTGIIYTIETNTYEEFVADATVSDKYYVPSSTSIGNGVGANGTVTIVTTYHRAKHILFVTLDIRQDGKVYEFNTSRDNFVQIEKGDRIRVAWATSFFGTSSLWMTHFLN